MPSTFTSQVIDASVEEVWELIREFDSFKTWRPLCTECRIEGEDPSDRVGAIRNFVMAGDHIREKLVALSDYGHY